MPTSRIHLLSALVCDASWWMVNNANNFVHQLFWMLSKMLAGFRRTFPVCLCEDKMSASTHTTSVESFRFSTGVAWISHLQSACGTEALLCHVNINLHLPESLLWPMVLSFYIQLVFFMKKDWRRNHNYAYPNMSLKFDQCSGTEFHLKLTVRWDDLLSWIHQS